jgi:hypothetical protein
LKHSRFWPNFANQSSTSGGQHWFERFQSIKWLLEAFRKCHYIQFRLLSGESAGMDENVVNHWKQNLPNIIQGYVTQGISGMWTKLAFSGKVCQIAVWYCKKKNAKQASWPRRDLPLFFSVQ